MIFLYSLILSLAIVGVLSLVFREEAFFWLDKIRRKLKGKRPGRREERTHEPIKEYCGFRDWSEKGGEICTLFQLEDGSEYLVNEKICRQCPVWARYQEWLDSGKKENLSVTLTHTFQGSRPMVVETDKLNPEMGQGLTFNDFVIKRRHFPWAGKAAIAFLTLVVYLMVYFAGFFSNPVVYANPDTFYFLNNGDYALANNWNMRDVSAPSSENNSTTITVNDLILEPETIIYYHFNPGAENNTHSGSDYSAIQKKGWMTDNNSLLTGTFPSGNWTVYIKYNFSERDDCGWDMMNEIQFKLWKADDDLNNASAITNWAQLCTIASPGGSTCSKQFTPGAVSLNNQVLYIEFRWVIQPNCGFMASPDAGIIFVVNGGDTQKLVAPTYEPIPENSLYLAFFIPFVPAIVKKFRLKDYFKKK